MVLIPTTDAGGADSELSRGADAAASRPDAGSRRSNAGDAAGGDGPTAGPTIQWVETARRLERATSRGHHPSMSPCPTKSSRCPRCHFRFRGHPHNSGTRTHPLWADIPTSLQQICSSHVIFCCFNTKHLFQISLVTIFSFNQHSELESLQRIGYFVLPTLLLHNHCSFSLRWKILFYPENLSLKPQSLTS